MIAAMILAGGRSSRMGTPKALLRYGESTFLEAVLETAGALGLSPRLVAAGPDALKLLSRLELADVVAVGRPDPTGGPIGSIQALIRRVFNRPVEAAVLWHVDQPHVSPDTVRELVARFRAGGAAIVVPSFGGKRGHPVVFGREVFAELLRATEPDGARAVVRRDPARVAVVPVADPAVLEDVDTPEAYESLMRRQHSRIRKQNR